MGLVVGALTVEKKPSNLRESRQLFRKGSCLCKSSLRGKHPPPTLPILTFAAAADAGLPQTCSDLETRPSLSCLVGPLTRFKLAAVLMCCLPTSGNLQILIKAGMWSRLESGI